MSTPAPSLYRQVSQQVLAGLGDAGPGTRLASERAMCERYGVSRVTMRTALQLLARQGVIVAAPARGWFTAGTRAPGPPDASAGDIPATRTPSTPAPSIPAPSTHTGTLAGFSQLASGQGQRTTATVLGCRLRPATIDEAEMFAIVPGTTIFELSRLRFLEGLVIAQDNSRVPAALCPGIETHDFRSESLYEVLRAAHPPVIPTCADYAVEAAPAGADEAELLELPAGIPLLVANQRTMDQFGRTVELGHTRYRGDRFRFRASIGSR